MKKTGLYTILGLIIIGLFQACGESEEERMARERARLDSLRAVQQAEIDRLMQARQDSIDAASGLTGDQNDVNNEDESGMTSYGDVMFDENGDYIVQVGAWRSEEKADGFAKEWAGRGYENAYTVRVGDEETGDVWFRVRIGFLSSREDAEKLGQQLQSEFGTPFWTSKVQR
jgi:septal ring-binding cell division protein DamX